MRERAWGIIRAAQNFAPLIILLSGWWILALVNYIDPVKWTFTWQLVNEAQKG